MLRLQTLFFLRRSSQFGRPVSHDSYASVTAVFGRAEVQAARFVASALLRVPEVVGVLVTFVLRGRSAVVDVTTRSDFIAFCRRGMP